MVQIISKPGFGEQFGQNLGSGIGTGLAELAKLRMQHLSQRQQQNQLGQGLQSLFGPEKAAELSNLPTELLKPLIAEHAKSQIRVPQTAPGLQQIMPELSKEEAEKIGQLTPALQTLVFRNYLDTPQELRGGALKQLTQTIGEQAPIVSPQVAQPLIKGAPKELKAPAKTKEERIAEHQAKKAALQPQPTIQPEVSKPKTVAELVKTGKHTLKEAREIAKEERKAEHQASKETKEIYEQILREAKNADDNDKRLGRMSELVNKGNLGIPFVNSALKSIAKGIFGVGLDLTSIMTADAQEFDKLATQFAAGAKDVFPGRVTNADLDLYMRQIPNLSQSGAGIKRIIASMKSANEAARLRKNAMKKIIKANDNKRPANLELLIEEEVGPQLDLLAHDFINAPKELERFGGGIFRY